MTVKKAISHIDLLIQDKQDLKMKMVGPVLPLPIPGDLVNRFYRAMRSMLEKDIRETRKEIMSEAQKDKTDTR